jgi:endonuclease/exonuclease/phosphatase family metal-dependent hydrolase
MRIMSLNGWGGTVGDPLLEFLKAETPDILCLQEVVHTPASTGTWLTYRDGEHVLPQRANLFSEVCRSLPDHIAVFCPAAMGDLWDGQDPVPSFWGLATFVRRTLPVIGQAQAFVHKDYAGDGYGTHPRSRSAHGVRIFVPELGQAVSVTQMHGLRDMAAGKSDTPDRLLQAKRLLELSDFVSRKEELRVICGDFNVLPDSQTLQFLAGAGFTELVTAGGFRGTRTSLYTKPGRFADYMLVNKPEAIRAFQVISSPEVSDHCPLVLDI